MSNQRPVSISLIVDVYLTLSQILFELEGGVSVLCGVCLLGFYPNTKVA